MNFCSLKDILACVIYRTFGRIVGKFDDLMFSLLENMNFFFIQHTLHK